MVESFLAALLTSRFCILSSIEYDSNECRCSFERPKLSKTKNVYDPDVATRKIEVSRFLQEMVKLGYAYDVVGEALTSRE